MRYLLFMFASVNKVTEKRFLLSQQILRSDRVIKQRSSDHYTDGGERGATFYSHVH